MKDIIVIVGPTGVGKTKLSIELAKRLDGEIINADSVAIYKDLNIGSAKPTEEEQSLAINHLINIRNVTEEYSVYDYQKDARRVIDDITSRNKRVIIVGGTGLYIKAALYNYEFTENSNTRDDYKELSNEEIYEEIVNHYGECPIHINNRQRLVRCLNKIRNNEQDSNKKDELLYPTKFIGLTTDRELLYKRIDNRVEEMISSGLLKEIESLKDKYNNSRVLNSGIGYKEFYDYLFNSKDLDSVIEEIKKDSRHYAKRQYTFFKNQFDIQWFDVDFNDFTKTINKVEEYIKKD